MRQSAFGAEAAALISSLLSSTAGRGRVRWPRAGASYLMWARRPWVFYIKTSVKSQTFRNLYLPNFVKFSKGRQESARPSQLTTFLKITCVAQKNYLPARENFSEWPPDTLAAV